ncbi:hypothetical protein ACHAXA_006400 [Cyclostephanos tholiformis]|uniref:Uncharacterized protein n=1 Tax=Cyclostephanos tholiformis TaxID=382380 RepID=A0ABD3SDS3_9STRA
MTPKMNDDESPAVLQMIASPPRGRTVRRRGKVVIRTGARAIEEAARLPSSQRSAESSSSSSVASASVTTTASRSAASARDEYAPPPPLPTKNAAFPVGWGSRRHKRPRVARHASSRSTTTSVVAAAAADDDGYDEEGLRFGFLTAEMASSNGKFVVDRGVSPGVVDSGCRSIGSEGRREDRGYNNNRDDERDGDGSANIIIAGVGGGDAASDDYDSRGGSGFDDEGCVVTWQEAKDWSKEVEGDAASPLFVNNGEPREGDGEVLRAKIKTIPGGDGGGDRRHERHPCPRSNGTTASPSTASMTDSSCERKWRRLYACARAGGTPVVAIVGHGYRGGTAMVQDVGNLRMLIDDLSYLSSAIVQSKERTIRVNGRGGESVVEAVYRHTAITAGAACGMAELISQSDARSKLLSIYAKTTKIGAIEAILESIACVPNSAPDSFVVCRDFIEGHFRPNLATASFRESQGAGSLIDPNLDGSKGTEKYHDAISSKALAIILYFVGIACVEFGGSDASTRGSSNRLAAQWAREKVLQHKSALQGMARLVADDPVVHAYLNETNTICTECKPSFDDSLASNSALGKPDSRKVNHSSLSSKFLAHLHNQVSSLSTDHDPTKLGRSRKRKTLQQDDIQSSFIFDDSPENGSQLLFNFNESPDQYHFPVQPWESANRNQKSTCFPQMKRRCGKSKGNADDGCSLSLESQNTEAYSVDKFEEKISLAMSRTTLTQGNDRGGLFSQRDNQSSCVFCGAWAPLLISHVGHGKERSRPVTASSLALVAANCIISGRVKSSSESDDIDLSDHNDDEFSFLSDSPLSKNPIVYANEMLRLSGSLPYYSRSMSETLAAILLSNNGKNCPICISYLQDRACSLSEAIDGLCCLSPNVSETLSLQDSFLVPSLLRTVAELAFGLEDDSSPVYFESTTTALKTLTSMTHENAVACDQMTNAYSWTFPLPTLSRDSTSSSQITGLDVIFSYLFKIASLKQDRSAHQQKMDYDNSIFCLNIITNTVEMAPDLTKRIIEKIVLEEGCASKEASTRLSGLTWLTRWVVSKTLGFQDSVMKGSFGSKASSTDDNELELGEEENLVLSGNGFVLLAYLIIDNGSHSGLSFPNIRDVIIKELPFHKDGKSGGTHFMIKVLKAFCNFYHYSVGDLSVAVIAPVTKLIAGLKSISGLKPQDGA